jgi:hypothetical protein
MFLFNQGMGPSTSSERNQNLVSSMSLPFVSHDGKPCWGSLPKRTLRSVRTTCLAFSDWLMDWTPWVLVISYWVVCTAVFTMCSAEAVRIFYYFYMTLNLYIAVVAAIESFLGMSPVRDAQEAANKVDATEGRFPTADIDLPVMDLVIVAYLPNEKGIVFGQLMYALEEIVYPREKLRISESNPSLFYQVEARAHQPLTT